MKKSKSVNFTLTKVIYMLNVFIYSIIFYFASVVERNARPLKPFRKYTQKWTASNEQNEDVLGFMDLVKGYLLYMCFAIVFVVLVLTNSGSEN